MSTHHDDRRTPERNQAGHGEDFGEQFRHDQPGQDVHLNEEPQSRLDFSKGDERGGHIGDPARGPEIPPRRVREAGRSGGEIQDGDVDADDLSPEMLIDEPGPNASDRELQRRNARQLGLKSGPDEAEMADRDPVGPGEARARRNLIHEHAANPNQFEFAEAQEIADRKR